jgi:hypothetical protein
MHLCWNIAGFKLEPVPLGFIVAEYFFALPVPVRWWRFWIDLPWLEWLLGKRLVGCVIDVWSLATDVGVLFVHSPKFAIMIPRVITQPLSGLHHILITKFTAFLKALKELGLFRSNERLNCY